MHAGPRRHAARRARELRGARAIPQPFSAPTTPTELVNLVSHYYRGEMSRMISWRDRIDRTTNWAITVVAAMLSVTLSTPSSHHGMLLFAMLLVYLLLFIESRRYRFFHVYRSRVRALERNYYARIFTQQDPGDPSDWIRALAEDLRLPRFTITLNQALSRRLRRNYAWLFLILLLAWLLKTTAQMLAPAEGPVGFIHSLDEFLRNAAIVGLPGAAVVAAIALFYAWLLYLTLRHRRLESELVHGEVHV